MAKKTDDGSIVLSALEEDLLTLMQHHADGMYGLIILNTLNKANERAKRRQVGIGSLYPALKRMEKQGLLKSRWGDDDGESGGARRRYYQVTALGRKALSDTVGFRQQLATQQLCY